MMRLPLAAMALLILPCGTAAQLFSGSVDHDPRIQEVLYDASQPTNIVVPSDGTVTIIPVNGDTISRATLSDNAGYAVKIVGQNDALLIAAVRPNSGASLSVETLARRYDLRLTTGSSAAYLVRFVSPAMLIDQSVAQRSASATTEPAELFDYRVTGDRQLRPANITDDGQRTFITWAPEQYIPAVFGIGPGGGEEVVEGHMREGIYTIDRVFDELWFRIDDERARARRNTAWRRR